jgi:hypothetical protein
MSQHVLATIDFEVSESASELNNRVAELFESISSGVPGKIIDASKTLLESVFRTIVVDKNGVVEEGRRAATFPGLYAQAKECIDLSDDVDVIERVDEMCSKAVLIIGQVRNSHGYSAHGREGFNDTGMGMRESLFIARIALGIANLFYGKHLDSPLKHLNERVRYEDFEEFNDYIDSSEPSDLMVAGIAIRPSEALFSTDRIAYRELLAEYMESIHE